ncbi:MAG TPA: Dyp-type peroxidase [Xanthomonadales bacterium]|nr:Dyp-type peroxidase [Xanthomonadales bacterium]
MAGTALDLRDIQAQFGGFDRHWPVGHFYYCRYRDADAGRRLLARLMPLAHCLDLDDGDGPAVNVAFTHAGLQALKLDASILGSFPPDFRQGMRHRAPLNGDKGLDAPENWDAAWRGEPVHLWIGVYARSAAQCEAWRAAFDAFVAADGGVDVAGEQPVSRFFADPATPMHIDDPSSNPARPYVLEHFGFRDGVSNPVIAGMPAEDPAGGGRLTEDGTWCPLAAGEFLLGHLDGDGEMPLAPQPERLARNGSFMVLRKLEQDVDAFRAYVAEQAQRSGVGADELAARMIGRRRDGLPLPDESTLNAFTYADDPSGKRCPLGAHMRRANPRDTMGYGSVLVDRHRMLRNGITYGAPVPAGRSQAEVNGDAGQGLMFLAFNASFTRQFEFVMQQWIDFGNDLGQGNDRDPLCGRQLPGGRMTIPGDGLRPTVICNGLKQFVRLRGGDYFFLPGIAACEALAT